MAKVKLSKTEFLTKASELYDKLSINLDDETQDFYAYESKFDELLTEFGKQSLECLISEKQSNNRKKKR